MGELAIFPGPGVRSPNAMLEAAKSAGLTELVIVGTMPDGSLFVSSSEESIGSVHWLLSKGAAFALEQVI